MASESDELVRALRGDLALRGERLADGSSPPSCPGRTQAGRGSATVGLTGVALGWSRAEEVVTELREEQGQAPVTLAQTGGEGEVSVWSTTS